jgi:hypothetical protein
MGFLNDAVDRAFRLILLDDRRRPDDEEGQKSYWRRCFQDVPGAVLEEAVQLWLRENPRGRPNVGKVQELVTRIQNRNKLPTTKAQEALESRKRSDIKWAISILENPEHFRKGYTHTLEHAMKTLRAWEFEDWMEAKAYLEPNWAPPDGAETPLHSKDLYGLEPRFKPTDDERIH